jgi:hypothetical protein
MPIVEQYETPDFDTDSSQMSTITCSCGCVKCNPN